jgi:hypothetical protein
MGEVGLGFVSKGYVKIGYCWGSQPLCIRVSPNLKLSVKLGIFCTP